jgi:hypothetical protein
MNRTSLNLNAVGAAILGLVVLSTLPSATAQSNCKDAKGQIVQAFNGAAFSGPVTNAGDLTGSAGAVFLGAGLPTNDPTTFSFTSDFTITTHNGELKARQVNVFDNGTGVTAGLARIDPAASTGRFAGATGYLFLNGRTTSFSPFTVELELSGKICYAR